MKLKQDLKDYFSLPWRAYVILGSTIINRMGGFVGPFLALILSSKMGLSNATIGFVVAINSIASIIGTLIGGRIIDKFGSRNTRVIFHGLHGLMYLLCVPLGASLAVIPLLTLASFFTGIQAPTGSTLIMANTKPEERKSAFSLNYIAINVGFSIGPLIAVLLYENHLNLLFIGDALSSFVSVLMIAVLIPGNDVPKEEKSKQTQKELSTIALLIKNPNIIIVVGVIMLYFVAFSQFSFGVPITAKNVFGEIKGPEVYGVLASINGVLCMVLTPFVSILVKPLKVSTIIALNGLLYAIGFGMYAFIGSVPLFVAATVIWTVGEILGATNMDVYIAENAPPSHRGRVSALAPVARRTGFVVGPALAGLVSTAFGLTAMWMVVITFALTGSFLMFKSKSMGVKESVEVERVG
ncbi:MULTISPECIES: MFS transporter [unclassified Fusibacter]|uniref:MFS transporter n=1 Tax=unclassified Fusibacter TaxID=2624464 RepID=UPI0010112079|nr:MULTISPECIES: MFS transporter [unclassified Fusibacter]MCK8059350.1 MFS transporter [Fusibacter sp. A2]NPE21186.1 MFS transporter [Fusibacter sp. A1]RXV62454.1 MFS transporter [Fusibacter sp. A1]